MYKDNVKLNFCNSSKQDWQWHIPTDSQWEKQGELIYKAYEKGIILVAVLDNNGKRFKTKRFING
jgi:hypothetical protein